MRSKIQYPTVFPLQQQQQQQQIKNDFLMRELGILEGNIRERLPFEKYRRSNCSYNTESNVNLWAEENIIREISCPSIK